MSEAQALIIYGSGKQALYYEERNPYINREGVKMQPILVVPSIELKNQFGLTDEDLPITTSDRREGIWMEYPWKQIKWLSKSKSGAVLLIWCDFDGSPTPLMRELDELLEWDIERDKTESRLRMEISKLHRELEDMTSQQTELARRYKVLTETYNRKEQMDEIDQG